MTITRTQANNNRAASTTSVSVTLSSGVTQGNLLVAEFAISATGLTMSAPANWSQATSTSTNQEMALYWIVVSSGLAGTTVFTFSVTSGTPNLSLNVSEWNSTTGWPASPLDKVANNTNASSTTVSSGTTATTTQASELWVAGLSYSGGSQTESGLTAGWTNGLETSLGPALREVYEIVSATGAASVQFTITTAKSNAGCLATFMPSSAAAPHLRIMDGYGGVFS